MTLHLLAMVHLLGYRGFRAKQNFRKLVVMYSVILIIMLINAEQAYSVENSSLVIEIVSVGNINPSSTISSLPYTVPAMSVALDELRKSFGSSAHFHHNLLYEVRYTTCPQFTDEVDNLLAEYYYTRRTQPANMTVFIAAGCTERMNMARLIRGWNLFMMIAGTAESVFRDKVLYPNVAISGNNAVKSYSRLIRLLLSRYGWSSISLVLDSSASPFHLFLSTSIRRELPKFFSLKFTQIDKAYPDDDFRLTLRNIQLSSRVVIFMGFANKLRHFMLRAQALNMTNGDYVYLAAEPFHHRFYGNLTWWHSDSLNEEALRAYQSLLVITSPNDDKNPEQPRLEEEFRRRSAKDFNFTYADDEKQNLFVTACYESIVLFGIVLKELLSSSASANLNDGALTAQHFLNRTFTLATGPITFDEVGERQQPLIIQQFQGSSVWPLTVMALDACAESFRGVREVLWPVPFPPLNEPACGFYGTKDQCRANDTSLKFSVTVGCSVLGSLLAAVFLMRIVQWRLMKRAAELHVWDFFQIGSKFLYSEVSKAKWASGRVQ